VANNFLAEIRLLAPGDAAMFRDVRLEALRQNPEAFASTFEQEKNKPPSWFQERISQADIFGAFIEDELLGIVGFRAQDRSKTKHKAVLWGMYVRAIARNSGLGRRLVDAVVKHASERVEQLQLTVVSENRTAYRLYKNLGFVEYGRETKALKQDGRYYDEILMVKFLAPD
jgi:ribosomal protein S18 acetylase RimI-like enzyme